MGYANGRDFATDSSSIPVHISPSLAFSKIGSLIEHCLRATARGRFQMTSHLLPSDPYSIGPGSSPAITPHRAVQVPCVNSSVWTADICFPVHLKSQVGTMHSGKAREEIAEFKRNAFHLLPPPSPRFQGLSCSPSSSLWGRQREVKEEIEGTV